MDVGQWTPDERERWERLTPEQRDFVAAKEPLWRRAHDIAARHSGVDVNDVYHVLAAWHETPSERLARALRRAHIGPRTR
jgi:hypothetical protein